MHRKVWTDAPFGGIEGGGFFRYGLGRRTPLRDERQRDDDDRRGRVGSRVACVGECVGGFGGGASRNIGADGWSDLHDGCRFGWTARAVATALTNRVTFWRHRTFDWPVANGFDELPDGAHRRCVGADIAQRCWRNGGCASTLRRGAARCARRRRGALRRRDVRLGGAATGECEVAAEHWRVARRKPRFPARKRRCAQAVAVRRAVSRFHSIPERLPLRQYASTGFGSASTSAPNASTSASPIRSRSTGR